MTSNVFTPRLSVIITVVIGAALMRLMPHWPNFTPVAAVALFGGAYISRKYLAFIIPIAALLISDLFIGFHPYLVAVYGSFILTVFLGRWMRNNVSVLSVGGTALLSSLLFFLITNFAVWVGNPNFNQDFAGLMQCYTVAIPFLNNGIAGDLFYSAVLFGGFAFARKYVPALQRA